jgi:lipopolysaccharide transport system ATP-binding protein
MSDIAIRVAGLGKRYRIGAPRPPRTLRETISQSGAKIVGLFQGRNGTEENHIWALKGVSFEIKRGEVVGIIGRNGAGKSTLLKILSRITEPTEGFAELHGRVGSLLEVGTGFHPELTGRENIYLNGAILGMRKAEIQRKFDEIVAFAEVEKFIDTAVKHYSSGMYVRLGFAVAAHFQPEILVVDEVLAVGDVAFQKKCLGKLEQVARESRTVLLVSHNMFSLQNLCAKGILLETGKITADGPIATVIGKYLEFEKGMSGEIIWATPDSAPGDDRARLKAVRIVCDDHAAGEVYIDKDFHIELDYWNLETESRRMVSVHLHNSMGVCVLTSGNSPSAALKPDPWFSRSYPRGLYRTRCVIPGCFLNDGLYSVSVYINGKSVADHIIVVKDVLRFNVQDTGTMRKEYTGPWLGAVRPRLTWSTVQLTEAI